jgi:hypothetical protein
MTQQEAYEAMLTGKKVRNVYYTSDEYAYIKDGQIYTEDGYPKGGRFGEFWFKYQAKLPNEWYLY